MPYLFKIVICAKCSTKMQNCTPKISLKNKNVSYSIKQVPLKSIKMVYNKDTFKEVRLKLIQQKQYYQSLLFIF